MTISACEAIAETGFEKIRMRMVAERAGVSTALLHYHFDKELWIRALRDEATRAYAVDLYAQLHTWVADAVRRGIASGEFEPTDVDELCTLVLSLSDGYGIRLMLRDPVVTLDTALASLWRHVAAALGLPEAVPVERTP
ncbi:TetR/AcrR family transcriptional regulator [Streptomyces sp. NPDC049099]|uniref:TetR/AcrR family transcriptional regulator n=1 Tax=Streptomyces sp. NPDC049099 TaxID=3155768 RepID=UPI003432E78E